MPQNEARGSENESRTKAALWALLALVTFHLAYSLPACRALILVFPFALTQVVPHISRRIAFYGGLTLGVLLYAPQLQFFYTLFGAAAGLLWVVLSLWLAAFLLISRLAYRRWGPTAAMVGVPIFWMGLEYARSELYVLRFSWLNAGHPIGSTALRSVLSSLGMYGVGFFSVWLGTLCWKRQGIPKRLLIWAAVVLVVVGSLKLRGNPGLNSSVEVAGIQLEETPEDNVLPALDRLILTHPKAQLLVLQEYLFSGEVPASVRHWCREHQRWLVVGGKRELGGDHWQNTAFVVAIDGNIVFEQGKKRPIQFFNDGISAPTQKVWESPWGKIGIAICYDLSYTRVMDELVSQGAQGLIIPTMDAIEWGLQQHELHALVAPTRATEYGIPILRVASSGISQLVSGEGTVTASAPCPGPETMLSGTLHLNHAGHFPIDRYLAPTASAATLMMLIGLLLTPQVPPKHARESGVGNKEPQHG